MKILHINTYDQGGAAIAAIRLHKALLSQGVDSSILFLEQGKKTSHIQIVMLIITRLTENFCADNFIN